MSQFSEELIARSGYLNEGFADVYDRYRPPPPPEVLDVLTAVAREPRPAVVVDVGCGTGLATRAWAERAEQVVGVDANPRMVERARAATAQRNVRYVDRYASDTDLPGGEATLVTTFQAFHWMEPQPVLAEAARVLREGGVFAACDYDVPAFVEPELDEAFAAHFQARRAARKRLGVEAGAVSWPKEGHLTQIKESGCFRHARELVAHGWWKTDTERMLGLAESLGGPRALFSGQAPDVDETFERFRETVPRVLGDTTWPVLLCLRLRIGVK